MTSAKTTSTHPISRILKEWHDEMEAGRFGDRKKYRNTVAGLFSFNGWEDLSEWTRAGVMKYLAAPKPDGTKKTGHTYNNILARLRTFETWAGNVHRKALLDPETGELRAILAGIPNVKGGGSTGEGNAAYLTDEAQGMVRVAREAQVRSRNAKGHRWAVYVLLALTGLRPSEMGQIERRDLNLAEYPFTVEVRPEVAKNGVRRFVPLNSEAVETLRAIGADRIRPNALVFPIMVSSNTVVADMGAAGIDRLDKRGRRKAIYSLRKWFATQLPADFKGKLLGHGGMTMRYDDPDMAAMAEAVESLPRLVLDDLDSPRLRCGDPKPKGGRDSAAKAPESTSPSQENAEAKRRGGDSTPPLSRDLNGTLRGGLRKRCATPAAALPTDNHTDNHTDNRRHAAPTGEVETLGAPPRAALQHSEQGDPEELLALAEMALQAAYAAYLRAKKEHTRAMAAAVRARMRPATPAPAAKPLRLSVRSA